MSSSSDKATKNITLDNKSNKSNVWKRLKQSRYLYLLLLPSIVFYLIFFYQPMYGAQIAFRRFTPRAGITGSEWVGLRYFKQFLSSPSFKILIRNTLLISIYDIVAGFPVPIILALLINEISNTKLKKATQTTVYLPHFISTVVVAGMITSFLAPRTGIVNQLIDSLGGEQIHFMAKPEYFRTIYVLSGIWQGAGWGSIIYLAALTSIDPTLYEAAIVDGATRFQRMIHITLPLLVPTIIIMLTLRMGSVFSVGYEKIMLLSNDATMGVADVILYYVYRRGVGQGDFSYSTAIGLFNSVLNFIIVVIFNKISQKFSETSLW